MHTYGLSVYETDDVGAFDNGKEWWYELFL